MNESWMNLLCGSWWFKLCSYLDQSVILSHLFFIIYSVYVILTLFDSELKTDRPRLNIEMD